MSMVKVKCTSCGAVLEVVEKNDFYVCPFCQRHYYVKEAIALYNVHGESEEKRAEAITGSLRASRAKRCVPENLCETHSKRKMRSFGKNRSRRRKKISVEEVNAIVGIILMVLGGIVGGAACHRIYSHGWYYVICGVVSSSLVPAFMSKKVGSHELGILGGILGIFASAFFAPVVQYGLIFIVWVYKFVNEWGLGNVAAAIIMLPVLFLVYEFGGWKNL